MKITRLKLTSFRSYLNQELDLDAPRVLIAGLNNAGKTGIREAIKWVLTARAQGADAAGRGAEILLPPGQKSLEVSVEIPGIGEVTRKWAKRHATDSSFELTVPGVKAIGSIMQEALYSKLSPDVRFVHAVLDTDHFLDLVHSEGKALVLSLLNVSIPFEGQTYTLDEFEAAYERAFDERRDLKRQISMNRPPEPPKVDPAMRSIEMIERQLNTLRKELNDLHATVGGTLGRKQALLEELNRIPAVAPEAMPSYGPQIEMLEKELAALEASAVPTRPREGPQTVQVMRSVSDALKRQAGQPVCVLDIGVPCNTMEVAFNRRIAELDQSIGDSAAPVGTEASDLTRIRKTLDGVRAKQNAWTHAHQANQAAIARSEELQAQLAQLPNTETQEQALVTMKGRIDRGEELLRLAREYWGAQEKHAALLKAHDIRLAQLATLETKVEMMGPKGVRVVALAETIGKFERLINQHLKPWNFTVAFQVEPWMPYVNGRPASALSKSERYRVGIAIQLAVAILSGIKFAIIDEMDMLLTQHKNLVQRLVMSSPLEQIIIIGAREDNVPLPKATPGLKSYRVALDAEGFTQVVERSGP